jgi:hypothetical protein
MGTESQIIDIQNSDQFIMIEVRPTNDLPGPDRLIESDSRYGSLRID